MELVIYVFSAVIVSRLLSLLAADCCTYTLLRRFGDVIACMACGMLIALSFGHLLPEALEHGVTLAEALIGLLVAFLFFWTLEYCIHRFFPHTHAEPVIRKNCALVGGGTRIEVRLCSTSEARALPILVGVAAHNIVDGIVIAMAFLSDTHAGIIVCIGMAAHEIAPLVAQMAVLHTLDFKRKRVLTLLGIVLMAAPVASVLCLQFLHASELHVGFTMLVSMASFFYVIVFILKNILFSEQFRNRKMWAFLWLTTGFLVSYLSVSFAHFVH